MRATTTGAAETLNWTPIWYTGADGFYEVSYTSAPGGPLTVHGRTEDKAARSYTVTGLTPGRAYYFRVRTFTPAHAYDAGSDVFNHAYIQPNNLWSDYTLLVSVNVASTATPTPSPTATATPTGTPSPAQQHMWRRWSGVEVRLPLPLLG